MTSIEDSLKPWVRSRYEVLREAFGNKEFRREDAYNVLNPKFGHSMEEISRILSDLRRAGLLESRPDVTDNRVRFYKLKRPRKGEDLSRADLDSILKKAADLIRTRVDYKYILILLFLKRISDKWEYEYEEKVRELVEMGVPEEIAREEAKSPEYHQFNLPEDLLWDNIRSGVDRLPERLSAAIKKIAELNPDLRGVFDTVEFITFTMNRENFTILTKLVELLSAKKLHAVSSDILGDAYEWVLRYFAPQKAKEGEVYTPREVIKLLVEMVDPRPGESVYDPAVGSGGMLIEAYNHVKRKYGPEEARKVFLYGQEANPTTYGLCKMNIFIHDIRDAYIEAGDSLLYPKFREGGRLKKFNVVIANPPWNQDGYDEATLKGADFWQVRYPFGAPTKQSADWAWIQHMLASADDGNGRVGVVIDNGALFRGGREKGIRKEIVERDFVEAVLLLPEKLFYNTGAPGAIIIFRKSKGEERKGKVLFINASGEYVKHPSVKRLNTLSDENIRRIVEAYREFRDEEGFSGVVPVEEIRENDYNLNVTLYVFPQEEVEEIDVAREWEELRKIEEEIRHVEDRIEEYLRVIR